MRLRDMIDKESPFKPPADPEKLKKERARKRHMVQDFETVK